MGRISKAAEHWVQIRFMAVMKMWYHGGMNTLVSVTLTHDEKVKQWGVWIPDVPAYGVGATPQEAMNDLKKALALYIEEVGKKRFLEEIAPPAQSLSIPLTSLV